jgi:hypothetical protein
MRWFHEAGPQTATIGETDISSAYPADFSLT